MKSRNLLALVIALSFTTAYAQNEEQVLNQDPIDVDGYLREKQVTDGELEQIRGEIRKQKNEVQLNKDKSKSYNELSKTTEKLSDTTEDYLDNKKSAQKDIAEYNAKIKCLMEENPGKDCDKYVRNRKTEQAQVVQQEVQVQQAAATSVAVAPVAELTGAPFEEIKLIPYGGATQYNGKVEQLEAQLSAGLRLESNVTTRFSMGLGLNYSTLKTQDFANNAFSAQSFGLGYQSREIQYKSMGLDIYSKFFITKGERFRPYVGAGLGYNRATSNYTDNSNLNPTFNGANQYNYGGEEFRTSYFSGTLMAGTEVMVTKSFGINIEGSYATGLGNSLSSEASKNANNNPDQARLRELGSEIINASAMSIFAGAVIIF